MQDKMKEINIEKIMDGIREEIKSKGYNNRMLSFEDVVVESSESQTNKFDKIMFNEELYSLNQDWNVQTWHMLTSSGGVKGKVILFFRKVIRKITRFHIDTIVSEQNTFNASIVRAFNLLNNYIEEKSFETDSDRIDELSYLIKRDMRKELNGYKEDNIKLIEKNDKYKQELETLINKQIQTDVTIKLLEQKIGLLDIKIEKLLLMAEKKQV